MVRLAALQHMAMRHGLVGFPAAVFVLEPTTEAVAAAVAVIFQVIRLLGMGFAWISGLLALALGIGGGILLGFLRQMISRHLMFYGMGYDAI